MDATFKYFDVSALFLNNTVIQQLNLNNWIHVMSVKMGSLKNHHGVVVDFACVHFIALPRNYHQFTAAGYISETL